MASRKGINISGLCVVSINALTFYSCTLKSKKLKGRTKSNFLLFMKLNDHQTRCFILGLRRIHPNGCKFEPNLKKNIFKTKPS